MVFTERSESGCKSLQKNTENKTKPNPATLELKWLIYFTAGVEIVSVPLDVMELWSGSSCWLNE